MDNHLFCGASCAVITPDEKLIPNLRALRDNTIGGVLDDICVRVIAIGDGENKALLISFDLDKAMNPKENISVISKHTQIPEENILLFAVHIHSAPIHSYRPEEGINNVLLKAKEVQEATRQYEVFVQKALYKAADEAISSMRPAKMGFAYGKSYININRNQDYEYIDENGKIRTQYCLGANPEVPVDRTLFVMKYEDMDGNPIAFFVNYPVHCAVMHSNQCINNKLGISGDIGGNVSRWLENEYLGCTAMWSSGAAGDINPLILNEMNVPNVENGQMEEWSIPGGDYSVLKMLASRHYADILKAIRSIDCTINSAEIKGIIEWSYTPGCNCVHSKDGTVEIVKDESVKPYEVRLHLIKIGEVFLYGFSGELYSSYAKSLKKITPPNTIIINHDASLMAASGYIFDDETLERDKDFMLPGHRSTHMLPGYFAKSLKEHTLSMFKKLEK